MMLCSVLIGALWRAGSCGYFPFAPAFAVACQLVLGRKSSELAVHVTNSRSDCLAHSLEIADLKLGPLCAKPGTDHRVHVPRQVPIISAAECQLVGRRLIRDAARKQCTNSSNSRNF